MPNRRDFLKSSATAALTATLPLRDAAATPEAAAAQTAETVSTTPLDDVNILQGTDSTYNFSRGNTLPIAALPFGMAHWTLQTHDHTPWMFAPGERRLQGFRATHQLSPWLGDYGHATFMPVSLPAGESNPNPDANPRSSSYRPEDAHLAPHSMRLTLLRYGIATELIPTERGALITASYTKPNQLPAFLVDIPGAETPTWQPSPTSQSIQFTSTANDGGVPPGFATYYILHFSEPFTSAELKNLKTHSIAQVKFAPSVTLLQVRIAQSFLSFEQAEHNLTLELARKTPNQLRAEAALTWNQHLSRIEIAGATPTQRRTIYSCLYRTLLFPRIWHEPDPANPSAVHHRSPYNGQVVPGVMYADHGYWDVYRAWYPLMTLLFPDRLASILQAWVNASKEGGWLPQFPCPGYRACMTGSLIDSVFGDAASKGLQGFDLATAYTGLRKHATERGNPEAGYGRRGIESYLQHGYCAAGEVDQSCAETVDAAYGDFCIAQVAKALGKDDDAAMFLKRSENWRHLFDPATGFLRGKTAAGNFVQPFDPVTWGDPYVEGAAWQHRFDVPQDFPALFAAMGGHTKAVAALERMLAIPADFNVGVYHQEIHEMSEMAAVPFGQYAHSNQPVHHILYLFALAGRPDLTRHWTRRVMNELYTPDTFAGDEDTGSMAAWYILSACGFYQVCPGKPEYTLGQPLFPALIVHLPQGRNLHITAPANAADAPTATFNNQPVTNSTIPHANLMQGGNLAFT